jgi:hypothetical protein
MKPDSNGQARSIRTWLIGSLTSKGALYQGALFRNAVATTVQAQMQANTTKQMQKMAAIQIPSFLGI